MRLADKPLRVPLVGAVMFANGGDNIGVYVPVFLAVGTGAVVAFCSVFLMLIAVLLAAARFHGHSQAGGREARAVEAQLVPSRPHRARHRHLRRGRRFRSVGSKQRKDSPRQDGSGRRRAGVARAANLTGSVGIVFAGNHNGELMGSALVSRRSCVLRGSFGPREAALPRHHLVPAPIVGHRHLEAVLRRLTTNQRGAVSGGGDASGLRRSRVGWRHRCG